MQHIDERGCAKGETGGRASMIVEVLNGLGPMVRAQDASPGLKGYFELALEGAAAGLGAPVSVWRCRGGDPAMIACVGLDDSGPGSKLLAEMKEAASKATGRSSEQGSNNGSAGSTTKGASGGVQAWPIVTSGGIWGALVFGSEGREAEVLSLLEAISLVAGLVVEREELGEEISALRSEIVDSERVGSRDDRYATIGQLASHAFGELDAILRAAISDLGRRSFAGEESAGDASISELRRAQAIVSEQLDLAKLEMPVLEMKNLNAVVEVCLRGLEDGILEKELMLLKRLDADAPPILLDEEKVEYAIEKVIGSAVERSRAGGRLHVETGVQGGDIRFQVTWEERGPAGGATDEIFVPFGEPDRGGMGLIVATQIIRQHGGGVRFQRFESGATALVLDFPIDLNKDRRRNKGRRSGLDRRRPKTS